ncbi:MAG: CoA-binding protein [Anaerolineales bacterium]|nr:CoA-binding protein [Anaerolineales bacterium]
MSTLKEAAQEFLSQKRIAVAGVSRQGDAAANAIFKKLRQTGHEVFPVNPNAAEVEGEHCYPNLAAIPDGVDGVVLAAPPRRGSSTGARVRRSGDQAGLDAPLLRPGQR